MAVINTVEHLQTGTDSIEMGDFKHGRVKVNFTQEECEDETKAEKHIDRIARLRKRLANQLNGESPRA